MDFTKIASMFGNSEITNIFGDMQATLAQLKATGEAAGGQVQVTLNGQRDALSVHVDESLLTKENQSIVQDFIAAAINDAERKIGASIEETQRDYFLRNFSKLSSMIKP